MIYFHRLKLLKKKTLINDYIKCVNDYYKITKVEKLKLELNTETDPMKQAKILTEIMKIRGVNNND